MRYSALNAGDLLSFAGSVLGAGLAVIGALWVEADRREKEARRARQFAIDALERVRAELQGGTDAVLNDHYIHIALPFAFAMIGGIVRRVENAEAILSDAKARTTSTDFKVLDVLSAVGRQLATMRRMATNGQAILEQKGAAMDHEEIKMHLSVARGDRGIHDANLAEEIDRLRSIDE